MRRAVRVLSLLTGAACAAAPGSAQAPAGGGFYLEPVVEDGAIAFPTTAVAAPSGDVYVAQWVGFVKVITPQGEVLEEPLVNLYGEVLVSGDRGMVGITLHPDFPATPYIYLFFPVDDLPDRPESSFRAYSRLVRYTVDETGRRVVPGSRRVLLGATPAEGVVSCYNSHSADSVVFGHDGALYVSHGDGASWLQPDGGGLYPECFDGTGIGAGEDVGAFRAQSLNSLSGKVLRLDPETGLGLPDNPFWTGDGADAASKVWAMGLRNPFRVAVVPEDPDNPGLTELVVGDVGSGYFEELNRTRGGENFGWPCIEGPGANPDYDGLVVSDGTDCSTVRPGVLSAPWAYFSHLDPAASAPAGRTAFSITGGAFYGGGAYPERFQDMLFFADYSAGWITAGRLGPDGMLDPEEVLADAGSIVDLSYDPVTGTFLTVDIVNQRIARLRFAGEAGAPPVARGAVSEPYGEVPHAVEFTDAGSLDPAGGALTYAWSFGDGGSAEGATAQHTYETPGSYAATLTVTSEAGRVAQSVVRVTVGASLPTVEILPSTPSVSTPDGRIDLALAAADSRGEALNTFWEVDLVHNTHAHPAFERVDGATGTIRVDPHAGPGEVSFYRARAVVVDQEGLRVERTQTVRSFEPAEVAVLPGPPAADGAPMEVTFSRPIEIGRVGMPAFGPWEALDVEVLGEDGWRPARFPYTLHEGDRMSVVFATETVRGVRVSAAPGQTGPLVAHPRLSPDADLGAWTAGDAGAGQDGRSGRYGDAGLVLAGGGAFADGAYHTARQAVTANAVLRVHLDALDGTADAFAGAAMHTGLGDDATGLAIGRATDGRVRAWTSVQGVVTEAAVPAADARWFRVRRQGSRLIAEASADTLTWVRGAALDVSPDRPLVAGPAVAGGDVGALAWFGTAELTAGTADTPTAGVVALRDVYPNPGRGPATLTVEAGVPGTYVADVVDARGRVVMTLPSHVVADPETFEMTIPRRELSQGVYTVRLRNADTGLARQIRFVTVR